MAAFALSAVLLVAAPLTSDPPPCGVTVPEQFFCGYRVRAAGDPYLLSLERHVTGMVRCESDWQVYPPASGFLSLSQALPSTWAANARPGADPFDPFEQGWFVANLITKVDPGSTGGWRNCWPG